MNRDTNVVYQIKVQRIAGALETRSVELLKVDSRTHQVIARVPATAECAHAGAEPLRLVAAAGGGDGVLLRVDKKFTHFSFSDSSVRVIRVGGVEELNPLSYAPDAGGGGAPFDAHGGAPPPAGNGVGKESKIPNIPMMTRCQNCDTNFPTKYQFQRHQCEFNADKVVLKPNVDARDVEKGLRMKFECKTCGKLFVSKNNLERHLTSHDEDNVNICEYCNKHFVSENRLRIHKENHCKKTGDISKFYRSDVLVWRCGKCFQVFASEAFATAHARACADMVADAMPVEAANEDVAEVTESQPAAQPPDGAQFVARVRTELLLQCEFCNRTYANKKSLLWHQDTHTTAVNYNCVVCDATFVSYTAAAKHWLTDCTNQANLFFLPKLIYCQCCNRTFKSHEILYLHKIKKKHYTPKKHFVLAETDAEASGKRDDLPDLIPKAGGEKHEPRAEADAPADGISSKETIIQLIDNVLGPSEKDDAGADERGGLKAETNSEASLAPSDGQPEEGRKRRRGRKRKPAAPASRGGKRFATDVEDGYKYQCERCMALFGTVMDMEIHRNKDHPANYKCEECDQVVQSSKALMIHSRAHQSLKPYVCEICKRCYSQTSHLWQHMRFHQGIKPFACPHEGCEARYTIRPDLKDHIRKVHTRERPFKCTVCDKCFLTGSVYYQHRLIHTNDRRYACDICDKRFFRADALNNHRRIHTDERPYPCTVCGRNFRQKGDRNKHVRTQHPDIQI